MLPNDIYNQEEGIDYEKTYAPVACLEAIHMLHAYSCFKDFKLYQMDVKSALLNGFIEDEVYVKQPPGFENCAYPDYVFKLFRALHGLKQTSRAWFDRLSSLLLNNGFVRRKIDTILFIKNHDNNMLIVQIYVDDIIFGSTNENCARNFQIICKRNLK